MHCKRNSDIRVSIFGHFQWLQSNLDPFPVDIRNTSCRLHLCLTVSVWGKEGGRGGGGGAGIGGGRGGGGPPDRQRGCIAAEKKNNLTSRLALITSSGSQAWTFRTLFPDSTSPRRRHTRTRPISGHGVTAAVTP